MIPILMYHSVKYVDKKEVMRSLHVRPHSFKIQMFLLKALGYRGCSIAEALDALKNKSNGKLVALTFDDGYQNFKTTALPILKKLGFSATVYIVSDRIGRHNEWDEKTGISPNELMTSAEIQYCASQGIEVGCHSATHVRLTEAQTELDYEILQSKAFLERTISKPVTAFCYPYGIYDDRVLNFVRRAGFSSATTMIRGRATDHDDRYQLPRIPVTWHTLPHLFMIKLFTNYEDRRRHA
jgi:peptidoglycan/xylan/chitin deacetylase (PgdA/CDA1 family)